VTADQNRPNVITGYRLAIGAAIPIGAGLVAGAIAFVFASQVLAHPRPALLFGLPVAVACLTRLIVLSNGVLDPDERPPIERTVTGDYFAPLRVTVRRLESATGQEDGYDRLLRPLLADVAQNRLARHHGVDARTEPDRARQIMGDELWRATLGPISSTRTRPPTVAQISALMTGIEAL
jgi:hypothetical protein